MNNIRILKDTDHAGKQLKKGSLMRVDNQTKADWIGAGIAEAFSPSIEIKTKSKKQILTKAEKKEVKPLPDVGGKSE